MRCSVVICAQRAITVFSSGMLRIRPDSACFEFHCITRPIGEPNSVFMAARRGNSKSHTVNLTGTSTRLADVLSNVATPRYGPGFVILGTYTSTKNTCVSLAGRSNGIALKRAGGRGEPSLGFRNGINASGYQFG